MRDEERLQLAVAQYLDICANLKMLLWHAVPNGGHMSVAMGRRRRRQGAKAGVADLIIYWPGGQTMQVELKTAKGRLSGSQKEWRERCAELDLPYAVCRSVADVENLVKTHGKGL